MKNTKGQSIIEIIVAIGIFTMIASSITVLYIGAFGSNLRDKERLQADMYLQQGFEAVRSMRDYDYSNLTNGAHGLTDTSNYWAFSGSSETLGQFTRTVTVADVSRGSSCEVVTSGGTADSNSKEVTVDINWDLEEGNATSISATQYINDWTNSSGCGDSSCLTITTAGAYLTGGDKKIEGMTVVNNCAADVIFDKVTPTWTNGNNIEELKINNIWVWRAVAEGTPDGAQVSGTELDIDNITFASGGSTYDINHIGFDNSMTGDTVTFLITMADNTSKYVEVTPGAAPSDTTAPSAIADLALSGATTTSLDLDWTSPGDDASTGTATSYDIRYSTSAINPGNWASATTIIGEPTPSIAGTAESMTVSGLSASTTYHFAIKTSDEIPNESTISNVPNETTSAAATQEGDDLSVDASGVGLAGANKTVTGITITNTGASDITIASMTVTWTGGGNGNNIQGITIDGASKWSGNAASGVAIDITDFALVSGAGSYNINALDFKKSMSGSTISITFTMSDASTATINGITP